MQDKAGRDLEEQEVEQQRTGPQGEEQEVEDLELQREQAEDVRGGSISLGDAARLGRRGQEMEHG